MGILTRFLGPKEERAMSESSMMAILRSGLSQASSTATGVVVSPESSLQVITVFACVRVLAESLAALPLLLYQRQGTAKTRVTDHTLYPVLHDLPNPEMTSMEFRETLMGHLALRGNAFANKVFDGAGRVRELWPLRPDRMQVQRDTNGQLVYLYSLPGGEQRLLRAQEVMHIRGLSPDGIIGYNPIQLARQAIGLALATEEYGARFFGNGARATTVLEHPGKLSDTAYTRLQRSWEARHMGLENAHRVAILEEGMKVEQIGMAPEDAQFLQTRKFQKGEIASLFRIPPHMAGDLDKATFGNIEHMGIEFVVYTMRPWLVRWEQAIARDLLTEEERSRYFAEFLLDALLRGDMASRYQAYSIGRQNGWLSANDIRGFENLNPVPGGDVYLIPLNMVPADAAPSSTGATQAGQGDQARSLYENSLPHIPNLPECGCAACRHARISAVTSDWQPVSAVIDRRASDDHETLRDSRQALIRAQLPVFADAAGRVVRRECNDIRRAVDKQLKKRSAADFRKWLATFYDEFPDVLRSNFQAVIESYAALMTHATAHELHKADPGMTDKLKRFVQEFLDNFAAGHAASSRYQLLALLDEAALNGQDPADAINERLDGWEATRTDEVAQQQTFEAGNALAVAAYGVLGVQYLRWLATGKSCPFCQSLNGRTAGIAEFFIQAGSSLNGGDAGAMTVRRNTRHGPLHRGCDCVVVAA